MWPRPFPRVFRHLLGADYLDLCERACDRLGAACVGFYVEASFEGCITQGGELTESDAARAGPQWRFDAFSADTGRRTIATASGGTHSARCYRKKGAVFQRGAVAAAAAAAAVHTAAAADHQRKRLAKAARPSAANTPRTTVLGGKPTRTMTIEVKKPAAKAAAKEAGRQAAEAAAAAEKAAAGEAARKAEEERRAADAKGLAASNPADSCKAIYDAGGQCAPRAAMCCNRAMHACAELEEMAITAAVVIRPSRSIDVMIMHADGGA